MRARTGSQRRDQPPVDEDALTGHVGRALGGEEGDERTQLGRLAVASDRYRALRARADLVGRDALRAGAALVERADAIGIDPPGRDHVDGDAVGSDLARE